jgi:hypothetical protein
VCACRDESLGEERRRDGEQGRNAALTDHVRELNERRHGREAACNRPPEHAGYERACPHGDAKRQEPRHATLAELLCQPGRDGPPQALEHPKKEEREETDDIREVGELRDGVRNEPKHDDIDRRAKHPSPERST